MSLMYTSWQKVQDSYLFNYIFMWQGITKLHTLIWRTQNWDSSYISKCGPKCGATHQWKNWIRQNLAEKFSRLPSTYFQDYRLTYGKNLENWNFKNVFFFNLEIFMWFLYQNSNNVSHLCRTLWITYCGQVYQQSLYNSVAVFVKLVNSKYTH